VRLEHTEKPHLIDLMRNELAQVNAIHQKGPFTASSSERCNIYLDSAFTMTGRFPCNG
jgi:hypothetical protein